MNKHTIAKKIQRILNELYPAPAVPLSHHDSYTLLIAVLLSAHCTDARVNKVTPILFKKASTPQEMVKLSINEIESIIHSCGLGFRKATNIWELSNRLIKDYEGKVPASFEALESLPGVGHKTASVVMSQAFQEAAFPVDTHIHRCARRWGLSNGKNVKQTEKDLKSLFPKKDWTRLHLQIIYFARQHCQARSHQTPICPICSWIVENPI
ncbi:Endonuclease III [Candidatus Protochlamydia amoebophila]|uniref:endonuclease III n=1 Tax=Candidatus Protochlamydia amoebophila TaxID=362787 RepID=UPI001BC913B3|nr:endonuclease III [Candidatus Protochlamydia amoebophila]MBS4164163.1 Endonuclease III [Candidatus Protochlamydia amoebophila]